MKRILTVLMAICIAIVGTLSLSACENNNNDDNVLKVGMECAYKPYNWTQFDDSNGAVPISQRSGEYANGYDVMIAKMIADELGMELEIYAYDFSNLISGVNSDALDLIIAGMSPTEERKEEIDFSIPYFTSNLVIVVRKDGPYANAKTLADFNVPNSNGEKARIVAQVKTFHDTVIDQIQNVNHMTPMVDFPAMITALNAKTIDGYIAEKPGATADCNGNSDFTFIDLKNNDTGFKVEDLSNVTLSVGVKKNSELLAKVNAILEKIDLAQQEKLMLDAINLANK